MPPIPMPALASVPRAPAPTSVPLVPPMPSMPAMPAFPAMPPLPAYPNVPPMHDMSGMDAVLFTWALGTSTVSVG